MLGQRQPPDHALESATMQFGYLDLGKRKPQRLLAPAATERPYLDIPVFGSEAR